MIVLIGKQQQNQKTAVCVLLQLMQRFQCNWGYGLVNIFFCQTGNLRTYTTLMFYPVPPVQTKGVAMAVWPSQWRNWLGLVCVHGCSLAGSVSWTHSNTGVGMRDLAGGETAVALPFAVVRCVELAVMTEVVKVFSSAAPFLACFMLLFAPSMIVILMWAAVLFCTLLYNWGGYSPDEMGINSHNIEWARIC